MSYVYFGKEWVFKCHVEKRRRNGKEEQKKEG